MRGVAIEQGVLVSELSLEEQSSETSFLPQVFYKSRCQFKGVRWQPRCYYFHFLSAYLLKTPPAVGLPEFTGKKKYSCKGLGIVMDTLCTHSPVVLSLLFSVVSPFLSHLLPPVVSLLLMCGACTCVCVLGMSVLCLEMLCFVYLRECLLNV